jgi:ribosome-associated protein
MDEIKVKEGIKLDQFLKFTGIAQTGGEAKLLIQDGLINVNDQIETRRGYRVKNGDIIKTETVSIKALIFTNDN